MTAVIIGVVVLCLPLVLIFNTLVKKRNYVKQAFASIDVQLKMRFDLIPNLIDTVKSHMEHERGLLEEITKLRTAAMSGMHSLKEKSEIDNKLTSALKSVMVSVENYPNLKTDSSFKELQTSLHDVESQLAAARRNYNSMVIDYNNSIETFPNMVFASMFGFRASEVFEARSNERENVSVSSLMKKSS